MATARNISVTGLSQGVCVGLQFLLGVVLARLLSPDDYGLIGLTGVFTGFAGLFADFGMGSAVVHAQDLNKDDLSFVFWMNVAIGIGLMGLLVVSAPAIAWFYHEPRLLGVTRAIAVSFAITAPSVVSTSLLNKALKFSKIALVDVIGAAVGGALGVYMAYHGFGVYSLVFMSVAGQAARTILLCSLARFWPGLPRRSTRVRQMIRYGGNLSAFSAVNYWSRNGDNLLVGKFCGAAELGIYSRAYALLLFPVAQIQQVLGRVMFPTLSSLHNSKKDIRRPYLLACQYVALITFPLMAGLLAVADDFVRALYGNQWLSAIPVIQVLAIGGMGNAVGSSSGWIFTSVGRTDLLFRWSMISAPVMILGFILGLHWGALGVATGYSVAYIALWYPLWRVAGQLIDLSFGDVMRNLARPFGAAVIMALAVFTLKLNTDLAPALRLTVCTGFGAVLYGALVYFMKIDACRDVGSRIRIWRASRLPIPLYAHK